MTTMELIERGIGHNCLSDAYDLGRADERVKVINEFAQRLMEEQILGCMLPDGFRADVVTTHTVDTIAEQLKEKI